MSPDRILVDTWDPGYGRAFEPDDDLESPEVKLDVETDAASWAPVAPSGGGPATDVLFVDGVQRVDARLNFVEDETVVSGIAGSFAAGAVRSRPSGAAIERVETRRGIFSRDFDEPVSCGGGVSYASCLTTGTRAETLIRAMTEQMRALERVIANDADAELVVLDGPLSGGRPAAGAVGLVKTHRRVYLPEAQQRTVSALAPGERTPIFLTTTSFSRFSWYLRLPGPSHHPWAGVVRCEAAGDLPSAEVRELADRSAVTLPLFASAPHRDPRAPQNLTPIGELERVLRHRLGDAGLLERLLRRRFAAWEPSPVA
ncbi:MAG: hypothetical protein ACRDUY_16870 [Nitriliruptorales bacterium]